MKKFLIAMAFCAISVQASMIEVKTEQEFQTLISTSPSPVVVQMSAYWCGPCQTLKATLQKVAESYTDAQVRLVYADAYVMKGLGKYVMGGYPTMRVFKKGQVSSESFTGVVSESYLRNFIDAVKISEVEEDENGAFCPLN